MFTETREVVPPAEAAIRLARALTDSAHSARALAHAYPEVGDEMRRASLSLVHAARDVVAAVEVLSGDRTGSTEVH